jgi:hypothetical protein
LFAPTPARGHDAPEKYITKVQHYPQSAELAARHEAGHVQMLLAAGVVPALVELIDDAEGPCGRTKPPKVRVPNDVTREVAVAGYAVELRRYRDGRLVDEKGTPISERNFIAEAVAQNAAKDKVTYFGENREQANKCWPAEDDWRFMQAGEAVSKKLNMGFVEDFAAELLTKGRLETADIETIGRRHGLLPRRGRIAGLKKLVDALKAQGRRWSGQ